MGKVAEPSRAATKKTGNSRFDRRQILRDRPHTFVVISVGGVFCVGNFAAVGINANITRKKFKNKPGTMNIKQSILKILSDNQGKSFSAAELCKLVGTQKTIERQAVKDVLLQLTVDRAVLCDDKSGKFRSAKADGTAVFQGNKRGFGFLLIGGGEDLFVAAALTHGAFNGDTVTYRKIPDTRDCAEVLTVVSRGTTTLVGTYDKHNGGRFVIPDDDRFISDVYIPPKKDMNAKHGQKVAVKINVFPPDNRDNPEGEIVAVLGYPGSVDVDMEAVAVSYGLTDVFPQEVEAYAAKQCKPVGEKDLSGRKDLRGQKIFTIDGTDAKDLDDAVSVRRNADGTYTLGVHIADVSNYVKPGGEIDKEAFRRGTSVYFPQAVFPMLPHSLCNGVCSLLAGEDRLTLTCQMTIDKKGRVVQSDVFPSVIRSVHRFTYDQVQLILDGDQNVRTEFCDVCADLDDMKALAQILADKRDKRGNVDFETKEVQFVFDEGKVLDVVPFKRDFAHRLIEEFMIVANETVAEYAQTCGLPMVYRVHEKPDEEKLRVLLSIMSGVGIEVKRSKEIHGTVLQDALEKARKTPYFYLINDVMLRTMQKAKYSDSNVGHFGLASNCYCHFTSPIRRYADLVVHRIIKTAVCGKMTEKALAAYEQMARDSATQASAREKIADEAERKADDVCKCSYAETILGQTFVGLISGVVERGVFVELPNTVEGFVSAEKLGAGFVFDKERFCLYNDAVKFGLGDKLGVTVASVNKQACKIDFDLARLQSEQQSID